MPKVVSNRKRQPWLGGLASLVGTPALTVYTPSSPDPLDSEGRWNHDSYHYDREPCEEGWRFSAACGLRASTHVNDSGVTIVEIDRPKPGPCQYPKASPEVAFGIGTTVGCSIIGIEDPINHFAALAEESWARAKWRQLGAELWRGQIQQALLAAGKIESLGSFLANDTRADKVELHPGVKVPLDEALRALEHFVMTHTNDSTGVIHADHKTVSRWVQLGLVIVEGFRKRTANDGVYVVSDRFYDGSGPLNATGQAAATADCSWAYATGPMVIRFDKPQMFPRLNESSIDAFIEQGVNRLRIILEGHAGVTWECVHACIQVSPCPSLCC